MACAARYPSAPSCPAPKARAAGTLRGRTPLAPRAVRIALVISSIFCCFTTGCASRGAKTDPQVTAMLRDIDAKRIESTDRALVSFRTRHTLSDNERDTRGIGAARRWIKAQLDEIARESGGRLTVEFQ